MRVTSTLLATIATLGIALAPSSVESASLLIEYRGSTMWSGLGAVSVNGEYVYTTTPIGAMVLHRLADTALEFVGSVEAMPGSWGAIEAVADRAFLVSAYNVQVMDISDPGSPVLGGTLKLPPDGNGNPLEVVGIDVVPQCTCLALAYNASPYGGVVHINAASLSSPAIVGFYPFGGGYNGRGMAVGGQFALTFWEAFPDGAGTDFVDISNPRSPSWIGWIVLEPGVEVPFTGDIRGGLAYLAYYSDVLNIVKIDSTDSPPILNSITVPGLSGIRIEEDRAYVFSADSGVTTYSLADSLNPVSLGSAFPPGSVRDIAGYNLYLATQGKLLLTDWSQPATPIVLDSFVNGGPPSLFVSKVDTLAFVSSRTYGIQIINVQNPAAPVRTDSIPLPGSVGYSAVVGHYLYVLKGDSSFDVIDVAMPSNPTFVNNFRPISFPRDLLIRGNTMLLAVGDSGLEIVSVVDPATPASMGRVALPGSTTRIAADGDLGSAVGSNPLLKVLDLSNPWSPQMIGQLVYPSVARDVVVADSITYVTDEYQGLLVIDVHSPSSPQLIKTQAGIGPRFMGQIERIDDFLVVQQLSRLYIFDISDPVNMKAAGVFDTPGSASHFLIDAPYIYVADGDGFTVLRYSIKTDVRDPAVALPHVFLLDPNRPNPMNAGTEITYTMIAPSMAELTIYNLLGMKVVQLVKQAQAAGPHRVFWDGRTAEGLEAPSGVYFFRLTAGGQSETRKMLLLR